MLMIPDGFVKRVSIQKYIDAEALLSALETPAPVSIRINPAKWRRKPSGASPVPWSSNGYYLEERPSYTLDPLFHAGCYYPQEASSMFIEQVIKQHADISLPLRILDLCGAPGGKSTHLSALAGKDSLLVSNDVIRTRASILAETMTKWGSVNSVVTQSDPSAFGRMTGYFDIILVDAPCSGEGMFRTETARAEWSETNTAHCSERQKRILLDVWPALKENGMLIYSTCTFNPGENEQNIKWLINKHKADVVSLDISSFNGIKEIDYEGITGYGFYPDKIAGEGFFISVIRKKEEEREIKTGHYKTDLLRPSKKETDTITGWTGIHQGRLLKWRDDIWGIPCSYEDYLPLFRNVKVVRAGSRICTIKNNDIIPAHDLALSVELKSDTFTEVELGYHDAIAFLRRDIPGAVFSEKGWTIVKYMGVNIGWVKNIGKRVNNYYPVEWRIRMELPADGEKSLIKWE